MQLGSRRSTDRASAGTGAPAAWLQTCHDPPWRLELGVARSWRTLCTDLAIVGHVLGLCGISEQVVG